jgi:hypothetical protein
MNLFCSLPQNLCCTTFLIPLLNRILYLPLFYLINSKSVGRSNCFYSYLCRNCTD